jgi:hypothetical protein
MHKCRELARTGAYRLDPRAANWVGYMIADVLNIKVAPGADNSVADIARIKQILSTWFKNKVLDTETRPDENRKQREFVVPGSWKDDTATTPTIDDDDA